MNERISVIGLGKLGASMVAAVAKRGFDVIGVDVNRQAVDLVNSGNASVEETDLQHFISTNRDRIRATMSHREAVLASDITFVVVPTPSDENGAFSLRYAVEAFRKIGEALREKDKYHLVVMTSTVLPGATRYGLLPILEAESGKKAGADFGLCYSPEFIALGSVIRDFLNPDFTLIGELDERSGALLEACYQRVLENGAPCRRMTLENAELTKVAVNTYVTTKITFANMIADLCERIPGGDVDVVTAALGADSRIGSKYLRGAIGYGGPCFPRDNVALSFLARAVDSEAPLAETTDRANRALVFRTLDKVRHLVSPGTRAAVLGLAYKPDSHVLDESQGVLLACALASAGADVRAYDPLAARGAREQIPEITVCDSIDECIAHAQLVLITTPDARFRSLTAEDFASDGVTVVDFWRLLDQALENRPGLQYLAIGRSSEDERNAERLRELWTADLPVPAHP